MGRARTVIVAIAVAVVAIGSHSAMAAIDGSNTESASVTQADTTRIERLTPVDAEVTVAPGADLLFEVAISNPTWGQDTGWWDHAEVKWFVDGEQRWTGYPSVSVNPHLTLDDVSSGTHMITGIVYGEDGEEELGTVAWVVHVEEGANEAPQLERVDPEGETVEVDEGGETRNFTLGASDPEGNLHRVLWFAGMCDDPLGATAVQGGADEATLTYEAGGCGVVGGWVVDERGTMNAAGLSGLTSWTVETVAANETDSEEWHTIAIDGQGTSSRTDYSFTVSGRLEAGEGLGRGDSIDGSSAEGFVRAGTDTYRFTGELGNLDVTGGDGVVSVDGEPVNQAADGDQDEEWHTITIDGEGTDDRADYTFSVSGDLEPEAGIGTGDSIDGSTAEGFVRAGSDTYRFTGELADIELTGSATVYVDDEEIDPS